MDGVVEAANVLVVGLTNRPELIDDALLRPGRLEVKLEVSLPDEAGRRDILRIHTRSMRANGALTDDAACFVDAADDACPADVAAAAPQTLAALTEHFSGAELAGLVRSAASFALGRAAVEGSGGGGGSGGDGGGGGVSGDGGGGVMVCRSDFEAALAEVKPARGRRDAAMARLFSHHGVDTPAWSGARAALRRLVTSAAADGAPATTRCALLVPEAPSASTDACSLAAWAGCLGGACAGLDPGTSALRQPRLVHGSLLICLLTATSPDRDPSL